MTPEGKVKKSITDYFDRLIKGGTPLHYEIRQAGGFNYHAGRPDIWCVYNGRHIELEIKREKGGVASPLQIKNKQYFESIGVPCYIVSSLDEVKKILDVQED